MSITSLLAKIPLSPSDIGYEQTITSDQTALTRILTLVYAWAGIVAVVVLIIAALLFVTSRGDATQMKRSKDAIRGAVIGLIVVLVAFTITQFVIGGVQG